MYLIMKLFTNPHRCHRTQNTFVCMCGNEDVCATQPVSLHPEQRADCFYCTLSFSQALDGLNHQTLIKPVKDSKHAFGLTFRRPAQGHTHSAQVVFYLTNVSRNQHHRQHRTRHATREAPSVSGASRVATTDLDTPRIP